MIEKSPKLRWFDGGWCIVFWAVMLLAVGMGVAWACGWKPGP